MVPVKQMPFIIPPPRSSVPHGDSTAEQPLAHAAINSPESEGESDWSPESEEGREIQGAFGDVSGEVQWDGDVRFQ